MIHIEKTEDAIIERIRNNIPDVRTVETFEGEFDEAQVSQLLVLTPFVLVHYGGAIADEVQRLENFASGVVNEEFDFTVGTKSLRSRREGQVGAYEIMEQLQSLFDGVRFDVEESTVTLGFSRQAFLFSAGGLIVYQATYKV